MCLAPYFLLSAICQITALPNRPRHVVFLPVYLEVSKSDANNMRYAHVVAMVYALKGYIVRNEKRIISTLVMPAFIYVLIRPNTL
jgi:hypothetical protein